MQVAYYNQGTETIRLVPIDRNGRPVIVGTDPTYAIIDLREGDTSSARTIGSGTATQVAATANVAAAAGPDQGVNTRIQVDTVANFQPGRRYVISENEKLETFVLKGVDNGGTKYLHTMHPLRESYTTSADVAAIEWDATFPSAEANDEANIDTGGGPYQAIWTYTQDGETYVVPSAIFLKRYSVQPWIDETEVYKAFPTLASRMRGRLNVAEAIFMATEDWVAELETAGKDPAYYRPGNAITVALRFRAAAYCLRWLGEDADLELANEYDQRWQRHVNSQLTGRAPHGTVQVDPTTDMAQQGQSTACGFDYFVRS